MQNFQLEDVRKAAVFGAAKEAFKKIDNAIYEAVKEKLGHDFDIKDIAHRMRSDQYPGKTVVFLDDEILMTVIHPVLKIVLFEKPEIHSINVEVSFGVQ